MIRTFFGKIRRKLFRIILGKNLFVQLENFDSKLDGKTSQIEEKISRLDVNINQELRSYFHDLIKHIHESKTIRDINTKTFAKYRSIYKDRDIVVMGAGPTLKHYIPKNDCITIGTNGVVLYKKVKLDYLFVQDIEAIKKFEKEILDYDCKKFISFWGSFAWTIPVKYRNAKNAEEYCNYPVGHINNAGNVNIDEFAGHSIPLNICNSPLSDFDSVIFPAVQFALWTYPKRVYIAGCDCSHIINQKVKHFNETSTEEDYKIFPVRQLVQGWRKIKEFQQIYYPDVEMISINPVFLKGLFKDEYTASYLEDNPDAASND
jgi:hypothetical protein